MPRSSAAMPSAPSRKLRGRRQRPSGRPRRSRKPLAEAQRAKSLPARADRAARRAEGDARCALRRAQGTQEVVSSPRPERSGVERPSLHTRPLVKRRTSELPPVRDARWLISMWLPSGSQTKAKRTVSPSTRGVATRGSAARQDAVVLGEAIPHLHGHVAVARPAPFRAALDPAALGDHDQRIAAAVAALARALELHGVGPEAVVLRPDR